MSLLETAQIFTAQIRPAVTQATSKQNLAKILADRAKPLVRLAQPCTQEDIEALDSLVVEVLIKDKIDPGSNLGLFTRDCVRGVALLPQERRKFGGKELVTAEDSQLTVHSGATSYTQAFTVTSRPFSKLVVWLAPSATLSCSNVKWGGSLGDALTIRLNFTSTALQMWELVNPAVGTKDIYFEATGTQSVSLLAIQIYNTLPTDIPIFSTGQGDNSSDSSTRTQTVERRALAMDVIMIGGAETPIISPSSVGAVLCNEASGTKHICSSTYLATKDESVTLGWEWSDRFFRHAMCHFAPIG